MRRVIALLIMAGIGAVATTVQAQEAPSLRAEVWTMGPGTAVWERFGHNALVLFDARTGAARLYNWGMFSFQQENFFVNFARGRMQYWMASQDPDATLRQYAAAGRTVWRQPLRLTADELNELAARLRQNDTDATRFYRYDYYLDNCSTRVRDAVDATIGGQLQRALGAVPTGTTFRSHTRQLVRSDLPLYTGLQLLLGPSTDRPISAWEEAFLPMELMRHLDSATRTMPDGSTAPLLMEPREVAAAGSLPTELPPAHSATFPLGVVGVLLGAGVMVSSNQRRPIWPARTWALLAGVAALILWAFWLLTDHAVARDNANLLLVSGLTLPLTWLVRNPGTVGRLLGRVLAGATLTAFALALVPGGQPLLESVVLFGPANLALAWVVHARTPRYP